MTLVVPRIVNDVSYVKDQSGIIKGSLDEKLPIYEQDPKSKRLDSFEKRFVRD